MYKTLIRSVASSGACTTKDAIRYVASVLLTEINSVTDNPTIFPDEDRIISGGNSR